MDDSKENPALITTLHDSSASEPLLSKVPEPCRSEVEKEPDLSQHLQITYKHSPRPFRDLPFLIIFAFLVLCTFGFGIFSVFHRNSNYSNVSSYTYSASSDSCVRSSTSASWVTFNSPSSAPSPDFASWVSLKSLSSSNILRVLTWVLGITLILSLLICFLLLLLLKRYTKQVVYVCLPFFFAVLVFFNIFWFVACTVSSSCSDAFPLAYRTLVLGIVFLIIGVIVWIFVANWHRVNLTVNIIGVASDALSSNLVLLGVLPCLSIGLVAYYAPIIVFLVFARHNGKIVPKESSSGEYTCAWKQEGWVPAYFALASLIMLWSLTTMIEAKVYVISGTIAQWYFAKEEEDSAPRQSISTSLRNAFCSSSGTLCLSGLLTAIVRIVRRSDDSTGREDAPGTLNPVLPFGANPLLSSIEFLNKFAINFAAITGEAYCTSARMTYQLLKRNLLSAVFVEVVSTRLLGGIVFVISAVYAVATWGILKGATDLGVYSYFLALLAWGVLMLVLGFFIHVLDNVIDTIYICYAIDRDGGEVCKQDVHEVYVQLPISGNSGSSPGSRIITA
ncbi:hypothetical protein SAY87_022940 [Trapa incisa]|uniref:Choline transporter-like protein n=1 Tax=Trapa incisa TaxID=236973 RepID=A0AAN7K7D0_9MYRT|nr:hypothetical protein SAY87_022940 [Trapa incisa]